eukprot:gb/GECG01002259.1/.p1 GENE.gb/GECG01002259.1/~~gb/GECG01002259.1/.p1  ORF type:complete len:567 (+),score=50.54 gb/GECG01002259.1/:1-1701(+)
MSQVPKKPKMGMKALVSVVALLCSFQCGSAVAEELGGDIAGRKLRVHVLTLPMYGHYKTIKDIATYMASSPRKHEVSFLLCEQSRGHFEQDRLSERYNITFVSGGNCPVYDENREEVMTRLIKSESIDDLFLMMENMRIVNRQMCEPLMKWYEDPRNRPDVIVYDADSFCASDLAAKYDIPRVARVGTGLRDIYTAPLDTPPHGSGVSSYKMNRFFNRLKALATLFLGRYVITPLYLKNVYFANREYFNVPKAEDYTLNFEGWPALYNTHWGIQHPRPLSPNEFLVGNTNNFEEDALKGIDPQLAKWITSTDVPVVYVSFGTMSAGIAELLARLYEAMKEDIHFRYVWAISKRNRGHLPKEVQENTNDLPDEEAPPGLAGSVWVTEWEVQVALLSHKQVTGFITHGGMNSLAEAIYTQTPLLCMGLFNDQFDNCRSAEDRGFGKALDYKASLTGSVEKLKMLLNVDLKRLIEQQAVKDALRRAWIHNLAAGGASRSAQIIEATAEVGKEGLTRYWHFLPWYQKYNIDIIGTVTLLVLVIYFTLTRTVSALIRKCCLRESHSKEKTS